MFQIQGKKQARAKCECYLCQKTIVEGHLVWVGKLSGNGKQTKYIPLCSIICSGLICEAFQNLFALHREDE